MKFRLKRLIPILFLFFLPTASALADVGPKPYMEFEFEFEGERMLIESGVFYECYQPDCSDAQPLEDVAVQGFYCYEGVSCNAVGYGFAPYHRLEITFEDGRTLESNIFETVGFISNYTVTVREADLLVEERFVFADFLRNIFNSMCCLGVGMIILPLGIFLQRRKK